MYFLRSSPSEVATSWQQGLRHRSHSAADEVRAIRGLRWAVLNGAALGFGATTRVGFWLWYAIAIGSFASGNPAIGAAAYGAYGLARGAGATAMIYVGRGRTLDELALALLGHAAAVRRLAAAQPAAFGLVVATAAGLYGL